MPFTRARHDGSKQPTSPQNTNSLRTQLLLKVLPFRLTLALAPLLVSGLVVSAEAKPLSGVHAWTSGSQTYIRIRPDVSTPPVAKVPKHTKLFVWGKKDGWYRVETPDHIFGWVYYDYISSPAINRVKELSDAKARQASKRTEHQIMFGSPELLKKYYSKYGAKGAVKGLATHGVYVASKPKPKPAVHLAAKPAPRKAVARKPVAPRLVRQPVTAPAKPKVAVAVPVEKQPAPRAVIAAIPAPEKNTVGPRTEVEVELPRASVAESPENLTPAPKLDAESIAKAPQTIASAARGLAHAAATEASRPDEVATVPVVAQPVQVTPPVKPVPVVKVAPAKPKAPARVVKAPAAKPKAKAKPKPKLTWRQKKREELRRKMQLASRNKPTVRPAQIAPVSPEELLRAREEFLANRNSKMGAPAAMDSAPASTALAPAAPAAIQPSSLPIESATPVTPVIVVASSKLKPNDSAAGEVCAPAKAAPKSVPQPVANRGVTASRGGSPRDRANRGGSPRDRYKSFGKGVADQALSYRGMPYRRGAASPSRGFDCSGLVYYVLRRHGMNPPRTAAGYRNYGQSVARKDLQAGDLVLFANTYKRGISHIGVYMGDGKFVHAATSGTGVRVSSLNEAYYARKYYGARRVK